MIKMFNVNMPRSVDKPLLETLHSGYITQGPKVEQFEELFGDYIDNPQVVALNSCTSALTLALRLADVGPGDEVISTPMTCTATNLPIVGAGAKIVWADIDPATGLIDPKSVEKFINPNTKAVMVCDWGGLPAPVDDIMDICRGWRIPVIEDAAHAFSSWHGARPVGSVADFTCFSFQAIKHLTTGDGGMLACKDPKQYERAKTLRWFGISREADGLESRIKQDITEWGYKFHMNDVNATIGVAQMKTIQNRVIKRHWAIARRYDAHLSPKFKKPPMDRPYESSYWLYTLLLPTEKHRDEFKKFMTDREIEVSEVHRRNDVYRVFRKFDHDNLPGVDSFASRMICIPIHAGMTRKMVSLVIDAANHYAESWL